MAVLNNLTCINKVIDFDAIKNQYVIRVNEKYYKSVAFTFLAIGAISGISLIVFSFWFFWVGGIGFLVLSLPLLLVGSRYYYQAGLKENNIIIDLQKGVIVYSKTLIIPLKTIKKINVQKIAYREPKKLLYSFSKLSVFQISIVDYKGNIAPLLKSDNENKIRTISQDLGVRLGVPVQKLSK